MTVENASTIAQLDPERPLFDDPIVEGDDHIRMLKRVLQQDAATKAYVDRHAPVTSIAELKASNPALGMVALQLGLRSGHFVWMTGDYATRVAADPLGAIYVAADATASSTGAWVRLDSSVINVQWFGAIGDNATDCHAAIQAAVDMVRGIGRQENVIYFPCGAYRVSDEIDIYRPSSPRVDIDFVGDGKRMSKVSSTFFGAGKALFRGVDPARANRVSPTTFRYLQLGPVTSAGGITPVVIWIDGWGEGALENIIFPPSSNSHLRAGSAQNLRIRTVASRGGGRSLPHKLTTGVTFTVSGTTLTASAALFDSGDAGRYITINGPSGISRRYLLTGYVNATTIGISTANNAVISATSGRVGWFDHLLVSITAGTTLLTASGATTSPFTADMVGMVVVVQRCGTGVNGGGLRPMRFTIAAYVSPTSVNVDRPAEVTATKVHIAVPVIDFYMPLAGAAAVGTSDIKANQLHVEDYKGLALYGENLDAVVISDSKLHGQVTPIGSGVDESTAMVWLNDAGFQYLNGEFDSTCSMGLARVWISDANKVVRFANIFDRNVINEVQFWVEAFINSTGFLHVENIEFTNPYVAVTDWLRDQAVPAHSIVDQPGAPNLLPHLAE